MSTPRQACAVALTGGIAAGKSAVTACFASLGVPVHDADVAARALVEPGSEALEALVHAFGESVLTADGTLNRMALRERVFSDATARHTLEHILHPRIRAWLQDRALHDTAPYCLLVIPLLAEHIAAYRWVDRILLVNAPAQVRLQRLMARDGIDEALAQRMLDAQASHETRAALADDVIDNTSNEHQLKAEVARLHERYLALAARRRRAVPGL